MQKFFTNIKVYKLFDKREQRTNFVKGYSRENISNSEIEGVDQDVDEDENLEENESQFSGTSYKKVENLILEEEQQQQQQQQQGGNRLHNFTNKSRSRSRSHSPPHKPSLKEEHIKNEVSILQKPNFNNEYMFKSLPKESPVNIRQNIINNNKSNANQELLLDLVNGEENDSSFEKSSEHAIKFKSGDLKHQTKLNINLNKEKSIENNNEEMFSTKLHDLEIDKHLAEELPEASSFFKNSSSSTATTTTNNINTATANSIVDTLITPIKPINGQNNGLNQQLPQPNTDIVGGGGGGGGGGGNIINNRNNPVWYKTYHYPDYLLPGSDYTDVNENIKIELYNYYKELLKLDEHIKSGSLLPFRMKPLLIVSERSTGKTQLIFYMVFKELAEWTENMREYIIYCKHDFTVEEFIGLGQEGTKNGWSDNEIKRKNVRMLVLDDMKLDSDEIKQLLKSMGTGQGFTIEMKYHNIIIPPFIPVVILSNRWELVKDLVFHSDYQRDVMVIQMKQGDTFVPPGYRRQPDVEVYSPLVGWILKNEHITKLMIKNGYYFEGLEKEMECIQNFPDKPLEFDNDIIKSVQLLCGINLMDCYNPTTLEVDMNIYNKMFDNLITKDVKNSIMGSLKEVCNDMLRSKLLVGEVELIEKKFNNVDDKYINNENAVDDEYETDEDEEEAYHRYMNSRGRELNFEKNKNHKLKLKRPSHLEEEDDDDDDDEEEEEEEEEDDD